MNDEHRTMIDDCIARESRLTDWERSFVDSLDHQLSNGRALSIKQAAALDEVWEMATEKG